MPSTTATSATINLHGQGGIWSVTTSPLVHEMNHDIAATKALTAGLEKLFDDLSEADAVSFLDATSLRDKLSSAGVVCDICPPPTEPSAISSKCTQDCQTTEHLTIYPSLRKSEAGKTFNFRACSNPSLYALRPSVKSDGNYGTPAPDLLRIWQIMSRTASKRSSAIAAGSETLSDGAELQGMSNVLTLAWRLLEYSPECRDKTVKMNVQLPGIGDAKNISEVELEKGREAWLKAYLDAKSDEDKEALGLSPE